MFEAFQTTLMQILILFLLMGVGFFLSRRQVLGEGAVKSLIRILFDVVTPCVIIDAFQLERSAERAGGLAVAALVISLYHIVAILLSRVLTFGRHRDPRVVASRRLCTIYTNCGFMGLPLLTALATLVGPEGVFYGSVFITINNVFLWTQGVLLFQKKEDFSLRAALRNLLSPSVFGVLIGLALFLGGVTLPTLLAQPVEYLGSMNTPLAMLIIGALIERSDWERMFADRRAYLPVLLRNIAFPLLTLAALWGLGLHGSVFLCCLLLTACPTAGNCVIFSENFNGDKDLASKIFTLSTLFSVVSLPCIIALASILLC